MEADSGIRKRLAGALAREDLTIEGLVAAADELLGELAPRQSRYKVTERPDARTVRYYVTQKLLPKPTSYEGGRARYSGRHLARLLLIKKLQSEHHTLQRIASVLETATDEDVLRTLFPGARERRPAATKRVKPERLVGATPDDVKPPQLLERRSLGHGVCLDIPSLVLADPKLRAQLANRLDSLARALRESSDAGKKGETT